MAETLIVCVSDTHGRDLTPLPAGDILVHAGDFSMTGTYAEVQRFLIWLKRQPHRLKVFIAGNHETTLDATFYHRHWTCFHGTREDDALIRDLLQNPALLDDGIVYLENSGFTDEITGLRFWGSPYQPKFGTWAFAIENRADAAKLWSRIPAGTHVLLTHGPAAGVRDFTVRGKRTGCEELAKALGRVRPVLHVCGHIHEAYGTASLTTGTLSVNACTCDHNYCPIQAPVVVKLGGGRGAGSSSHPVDCRSTAGGLGVECGGLDVAFGSEPGQQQRERASRSTSGGSDGDSPSSEEGDAAKGLGNSTSTRGEGVFMDSWAMLEGQVDPVHLGFKVESVSKAWGQ